MAIFDILKRKKKVDKKVSSVKVAEGKKKIKPEIKKVASKTQKPLPEVKPAKAKGKRISLAWKVLKFPHITEKATNSVSKNQYAFNVWENSNKIEIKKAIEDIYGVDVISVKIIAIPSKKRRLGRTSGFKKGYKKAIVKIKEGQKIEVLPR
jgi:large subunit ribosomal protein L23